MNIQIILKEKQDFDDEQNKELKIEISEENSNKNEDDEYTEVALTTRKLNDLEGQLIQFLLSRFENKHTFERQYNTKNGKIDIVVDNERYGIELKIAESNKILENLVGQVHKYVDYFGKNKIAVIILITKKINLEILDRNIKLYESIGSKVLILESHKGIIKRRNNNVTKLMIFKGKKKK